MKKKSLANKFKKPMIIGGIVVISLTSAACAKTASATVETTLMETTTAEITTAEATTEVDINNETVSVEMDKEAVVKLNTITLLSGYEFTEDEANTLDLMITTWIEKPELQRDFLEERVNDKDLFKGLSDADKVDLVEQIVTKYPHTAPVEATKPASKPAESKSSTPTNKPAESKPVSKPKETKAPAQAQDNSGSIDWGAMAEEEMAAENEAAKHWDGTDSGITNVGPVTIDPDVLKGAEEAGAQGN